MRGKISIRTPLILLALVVASAVTLTALWNVALVHDYNLLKELTGGASFHTAFIVIGSFLLLAIVVLSTVLAIQLVTSLRWRQRQSNFIASVSHELNSPLSAIKLFAQTLRNEDLAAPDRARFVSKILVNSDRLSHMIANILRAAEVEARGDALPVAPGEVDLCAYLRDYLEDAKTVYAGAVRLSLTGVEEALVEIDPVMFRQVLDNLVDNAIRYRGEHPAVVEMRVLREDGSIELQVIDEGIGIPASMLENVFERFYQVEGRRTGRRGIGIGLHVVRSIVKSLGGAVGARSGGLGAGTTVWIRLPALERAAVRA